ncbi:SDR family NAD(P)-dependent oxidoreductase [Pontixanthobacter aquaemixtae]|uniref:SDR family NAD(P)-dependent oxidoreductase n=1 Tax=Pontixanthobacter aquaemixtae TaxID=1958940 RepID=A0A844ZPY0_9SPHN|nr:SDR family NAD(P)-dependent oxidoreductase [Pontixanthobacter aquaemixtae]MXO89905.1 SDR family NAD(P)-dependent oxidoreductase [Pontixanthobacter aquaemixtae]
MTGKVAVVTGASRGLGRGIARGLGSKGMTVYLTGRDHAQLQDAARELEEAGGKGIPVACDHADDDQVAALFRQVESEQGRLDLLVNNAAAVHPQELSRPGPFWEKDLGLAQMIDVGLRSNYVAAYHAAPLMLKSEAALVANISFYGASGYFHGPAYGAAKAGTDKMTFDMGIDFAETPVSVVSIWPGFILTDMVKAIPEEQFPPEMRAMLPEWEHPEFTGLVLAAMLEDPNLKSLSGRTVIGAQMGEKYGVQDIDGKQPRDWTDRMGEPLKFYLPPQGKTS